MDDKIIISGLRVFGRHGVTQFEKDTGQFFVIDLECFLDLGRAGLSDELTDTVDYDALTRQVQKIVSADRTNLIEALAEKIAAAALERPQVESVMVRVSKTAPPMEADLRGVAVEIRRYRTEPLGFRP